MKKTIDNLNEWQAKEMLKRIVKGFYNDDCSPEVEQIRAELEDDDTKETSMVNDMSEKRAKDILTGVLESDDPQKYLEDIFY